MSSSCVPPKGAMVSSDPNPGATNEHNHGGDTDSECGSFCTCTTNSSMTSLATSVTNSQSNDDHDSRRDSSVSAAEPLPEEDEEGEEESTSAQRQGRPQRQQTVATAIPTPPTGTATAVATGQATGANGSSYFVVFVPPAVLPGQNTNNCGNCQGQPDVNLAMKTSFLTALEFCPWVAGIVFIYYAFYLWGIGPGFSAFLFVMGTHALIRFLRTKGPTECGLFKLNRVDENNPPPEMTENEEAAPEVTVEAENANAPEEIVNENPPSYEVAVVKPPPYDLYHHLTPTQPRCQIQPDYEYRPSIDDNFLSVPQLVTKKEPSQVDEDDDVFLPSYQDAIRLSICSGKDIEAFSKEES
ncbi:uncharacterized protein [Palaemon carinicauda]|uniref:uncharacterized protein n=1 Tax=Palaemon carinicauda TaxID=392227 RepID=UPI0035B66DCA